MFLTPQELLINITKAHPNAWKEAEMLLADKEKKFVPGLGGCFIPTAIWYAIVLTHADLKQPHALVHCMYDAALLAALGAWRYTQGIYRFKPKLYQTLKETLVTGELPVEQFLRLPEWCLYIETPGIQFNNEDLHGFWVYLDRDLKTDKKQLRLVINAPGKLIPFILSLGPWTVTEAYFRVYEEGGRMSKQQNVPLPDMDMDAIAKLAQDIQPLLSLTLYLCSEESKIKNEKAPGSQPANPQPKQTKKGLRLFPPPHAQIWTVGEE